MTPELSTPQVEAPRVRSKLFVRHAPREHFGYLLGSIGYEPTRLFAAIEAVDSETGRVRGMIGYDYWTETSVQMHVVLERPSVALTLLRPAFDFAFNHCGKRLAIGLVSSENESALRFDKGIGFRETYRVRDAVRMGVDMVLLEMRRDECRWLKRKP